MRTNGDIAKLNSQIAKIKRLTGEISDEVMFSYEEQEIIHRVFKAVHGQFKSVNDIIISRKILKKTDWVE